MVIVFDLDNTLADEFGAAARPGVHDLLRTLVAEGHRLVLWTNSKRSRGLQVLHELSLREHFQQLVFREDYDPRETGEPKDIRKVGGNLLVDDDPEAIRFVESIGLTGLLVPAFRKGRPGSPIDMAALRSLL